MPVAARPSFGLDDEYLESFCKAEGRANELRLDRCSAALCTCRVARRLLQTSMQSPRGRLVAGPSKEHHHQQQHYSPRLYSLGSTRSALWIFLPPSYSLDGRFEGPTPFIGQLASAPRCAATSLLLRSCTVVLTIKRWDAPGPAALTLRSTIMVADWCLRRPGCILILILPLPPMQVRLGLLARRRVLLASAPAVVQETAPFRPRALRVREHPPSPSPRRSKAGCSA